MRRAVIVGLAVVLAGCYAAPGERAPAATVNAPAQSGPCDWVPLAATTFQDRDFGLGSYGRLLPRIVEADDGLFAVPSGYASSSVASYELFAADGGELTQSLNIDRPIAVIAQPNGFMVVGSQASSDHGYDVELTPYPRGTNSIVDSAGTMAFSSARVPAGGTAYVWVDGNPSVSPRQVNLAAVGPRGDGLMLERILATQDGGEDPATYGALVGVTQRGHVLALWQSAADGPATHAQWVTARNAPGEPFDVAGIGRISHIQGPFDDPRSRDVLVPLVDGSLALRLGGRWVGVFASGATALSPPPAWLQSADGLDLVTVARGQGYALFSPHVDAAVCTQRVRLVDASGIECSPLQLDMGPTCGPGWLSIGNAGSAFAVLPPSAATDPFVHANVRRWPFLLR